MKKPHATSGTLNHTDVLVLSKNSQIKFSYHLIKNWVNCETLMLKKCLKLSTPKHFVFMSVQNLRIHAIIVCVL